MKFFKNVKLLIKIVIIMVWVVMHIPVVLAGFIIAEIIDAFQAGMDKSEKFCDWMVEN